MKNKLEFLPCPFCGVKPKIGISDDEGNEKDESYESDPWSGLSYRILHSEEDAKDCPIASYAEDGGSMGIYLYDTKEDAVNAWNKRYKREEESRE